jgi:hypothetical protein
VAGFRIETTGTAPPFDAARRAMLAPQRSRNQPTKEEHTMNARSKLIPSTGIRAGLYNHNATVVRSVMNHSAIVVSTGIRAGSYNHNATIVRGVMNHSAIVVRGGLTTNHSPTVVRGWDNHNATVVLGR